MILPERDAGAAGTIAVKLLCRIGMHRWRTKATARPGTSVSRCRYCSALRVRHAKKRKP